MYGLRHISGQSNFTNFVYMTPPLHHSVVPHDAKVNMENLQVTEEGFAVCATFIFMHFLSGGVML